MSIPSSGRMLRRATPALCLLALGCAQAAESTFAAGEGKVVWTTRVVAGTGIRTTGASPHLVGKGFRSDGVPKGGDGSDTSDDGNLNYGAAMPTPACSRSAAAWT